MRVVVRDLHWLVLCKPSIHCLLFLIDSSDGPLLTFNPLLYSLHCDLILLKRNHKINELLDTEGRNIVADTT